MAKAAQTTDETKREALPRPIPQGALRRAEEVRNHYRLTLPTDLQYRDLFGDLAPGICTVIAPFLTRGDTIEVVDSAGSVFGLLFLEEHVAGRIVRFTELFKAKLSGETVDDMSGTGEYRAAWGGWERRYCLVRPGGGVAREGMRTREEAGLEAHTRNRPQQGNRQTLA